MDTGLCILCCVGSTRLVLAGEIVPLQFGAKLLSLWSLHRLAQHMMQTKVVSPNDKVLTQQILVPFHNSELYGKHLADMCWLFLRKRGKFFTVEGNRVCILCISVFGFVHQIICFAGFYGRMRWVAVTGGVYGLFKAKLSWIHRIMGVGQITVLYVLFASLVIYNIIIDTCF